MTNRWGGYILFLGLSSMACAHSHPKVEQSQSPSVAGEYILLSNHELNEKALLEAFSPLTLLETKTIGERRYFLKFRQDPGVDAIQKNMNQSGFRGTLQRNLVYSIGLPNGAKRELDQKLRK